MTVFLKFIDEAAAVAAFSPWSVDGAIPAYIGGAAIDVVGVIQRPTGEVLQTEAGEIPVLAPVPGWFINLSESVAELAQYEMAAPDTPARIFAGSDDILAPHVPAEVARWQAKLALMQQLDEQGTSLWARLQQLLESLTDVEQQTMLDAAMSEVLNWKRFSPTVIWAAGQLELTEQQVDQLFIYAHALEL